MNHPLQITFRDMAPSPAVERAIEERVAKLENQYGPLQRVQVVIDTPHRTQQHKRKTLRVHVDVRVPGGEIVVNNETSQNHGPEELHLRVRDAFDGVIRQLEGWERRRKAQVKLHVAPPMAQVIRHFPQQGYGFLRTPDGLEVYFHENAVENAAFQALEVGSEVTFVYGDPDATQGPRASTVRPVGKHRPAAQGAVRLSGQDLDLGEGASPVRGT